jgi:DNA modification methylase
MAAAGQAKSGGRQAGTPNRPKPTANVAAKSDVAPAGAKLPPYKLAAIGDLVEYERNPRVHSDSQVAKIAASITEFGFTNPLLVDGHKGIIAGHGRLQAARLLGLAVVPTITLTGLSDAQKRALVIADNALALDASWDTDMLALELGELRDLGFDLSLTGFDLPELGRILGPDAGNTDPDDAPAVQAVAVSRTGDVWIMGRHRLVCGDCTDAAVVEAALAGAKPHLMVTDPPYGVSLDPSWRDNHAGANKMAKAGKGGAAYMDGGKGDTDARWDATWKLSPADVFYVWCAPGPKQVEVHAALLAADFETRQFLIWDKGILTLTRTQYWYTHETCLYGCRKGMTAHWVGKAGQGSVWTIASPKHIMSGSKEQNEPHPAQKPVECMRRPIENNSAPGDAVYDPFLGSGTTLIAAEQTGRCAIGIEVSPQYVDVAVRRWQSFTGQEAIHEPTGRPFAAIAAERATATDTAGP